MVKVGEAERLPLKVSEVLINICNVSHGIEQFHIGRPLTRSLLCLFEILHPRRKFYDNNLKLLNK